MIKQARRQLVQAPTPKPLEVLDAAPKEPRRLRQKRPKGYDKPAPGTGPNAELLLMLAIAVVLGGALAFWDEMSGAKPRPPAAQPAARQLIDNGKLAPEGRSR